MSSYNVLIFGPTGAVAGAAAQEARRRGATVHLAMRDPSKPISGLSSDAHDGYQRVQADLSDAPSVTRAVHQSQATTAFVYVLFSSSDHMASSFAAMQEAGIKFVVLLSSVTVQGDAENEANMSGFLSRRHAQTEVSLKNSRLSYIALRPAYFSSNVLWLKADVEPGVVGLVYPDTVFDFIAPSDIGIVAGAMLTDPESAKGCQHDAMVLCGPELMTQRRAHGHVIPQALGRQIQVRELSEEQWMDKLSHVPRELLDDLLQGYRKNHEGHDSYPKDKYEPAAANIRRFKGAEPTTLAEWVTANKHLFK
ncbi:hypothetical protein ACEQ8H_004304 [Pleosporales sp. CAS-2024a]